MSDIKLELYLVRHGQSMSNAGSDGELNYEFKNDSPLSELGVKQAELLGEYFADLPLDCILASGLRRASRTAYEVAKRQPENGCKSVELHGIFTECGTGEECEGRTIDEIRRDIPCALCAEGTDNTARIIQYSKDFTDAQLLERAQEAMDYILNRFHDGEKVMVAAHGAFNTFLLYAALGLSWQQIFDPQYYNTGITKIIFYNDGKGPWADIHLVYHNAVPHLANIIDGFKH